jgi:hypothetical protein
MSHGSDEGDNYWPGYVDALTSMVQVLAFVMMMLALAVFSLSQSASKHAVEVIAKAVNAEALNGFDNIGEPVIDWNKLDDLPQEKYRLFEEVSALPHVTKDENPRQPMQQMIPARENRGNASAASDLAITKRLFKHRPMRLA